MVAASSLYARSPWKETVGVNNCDDPVIGVITTLHIFENASFLEAGTSIAGFNIVCWRRRYGRSHDSGVAFEEFGEG